MTPPIPSEEHRKKAEFCVYRNGDPSLGYVNRKDQIEVVAVALAEAEQTGIEKGLQSEEVKGLYETAKKMWATGYDEMEMKCFEEALAAFSARLKREILGKKENQGGSNAS